MLTAVLLAPFAVLLGQVLARDGLEARPGRDHSRGAGGGRTVPRSLPLAVPRPGARANLRGSEFERAAREATAVVFDSFHRYLGVAVGECLGYLFTGAWTLLVAIAMLQSSSFEDWWPGRASLSVPYWSSARLSSSVASKSTAEAGRDDRPGPLHRLVAVAARRGNRPSGSVGEGTIRGTFRDRGWRVDEERARAACPPSLRSLVQSVRPPTCALRSEARLPLQRRIQLPSDVLAPRLLVQSRIVSGKPLTQDAHERERRFRSLAQDCFERGLVDLEHPDIGLRP